MQVFDKLGKPLNIFKAPRPVKGKSYDDKLLFGGQMPLLIKKIEAGSKIEVNLGTKRKVQGQGQTPAAKKARSNFLQRRDFRKGQQGKGQYKQFNRFKGNKGNQFNQYNKQQNNPKPANKPST